MPNGSTGLAGWSRTRWILTAFAVIAIAVVAALLVPTLHGLHRYPEQTANSLRTGEVVSRANLSSEARVKLEKDLMLYETESRIKIWTAVVQALGGAVLLIGLVFTWRNLRATQIKLDIDREGQLTNRFTAATTQLGAQLGDGDPNVEARLGGIYALAAIARDSPRDYWPVMEILTAYVRHNAVWSEAPQSKPRTDIQAILTVLGRSEPPEARASRFDQKLDLRSADLRGAEFWDAHLERTDFWGAHLEGAQLWGACLNDAKLVKAHLVGANLKGAKFAGADLGDADLTRADLDGADLRNAMGLTIEQVKCSMGQGKGALLPQDFPEASSS